MFCHYEIYPNGNSGHFGNVAAALSYQHILNFPLHELVPFFSIVQDKASEFLESSTRSNKCFKL